MWAHGPLGVALEKRDVQRLRVVAEAERVEREEQHRVEHLEQRAPVMEYRLSNGYGINLYHTYSSTYRTAYSTLYVYVVYGVLNVTAASTVELAGLLWRGSGL